MIFCTDTIDVNILKNIISLFSNTDYIALLPLMFVPDGQLRLICPCCLLDRRIDNAELKNLQQEDAWSGRFEKKKFRQHFIDVPGKNNINIEEGFSLRSVTEYSRRSRYSNIDTPIFKGLGFKGHRFDKNIFFPLGILKLDSFRYKIGIPNPDSLESQPLIQRVVASWIFRLIEVPPMNFPDLLPISTIGNMVFGKTNVQSLQSYGQKTETNPFLSLLIDRTDKRALKKLGHMKKLSGGHSSPQDSDDAGWAYDLAA